MSDADYLAAALDRGEDVRLALHEAGHATAGQMIGAGLWGPVSIRSTRRWGGVAHTRRPHATFDPSEFDSEAVLPLWPASLRSAIEVDVLISLCGPLAEALMPPPRACRTAALAREVAHVRLGRAVRDLNERDRELLAKGNCDKPPPPSDEESAREKVALLAPGASAAYLAVLRGEAARLVATPRFGRLCRALAVELLEHTDVGQQQAELVLAEADVNGNANRVGGQTMAIRDKKPQPDPDKWFVAWTGFAVADDHRVVSRGQWLLGSDLLVRLNPQFFVPADTPPHEWPPLVPVEVENS